MITLTLKSNGINFGLILNGKMIYTEKIHGDKNKELNYILLKYMIKRRLIGLGLLKESVMKNCPKCRTDVILEEIEGDDDLLVNNIHVMTYIRPTDAKIFIGTCKVCVY